jgi:D-sedoheptulose 7-phosphate isomerase
MDRAVSERPFAATYLAEAREIVDRLDVDDIELMATILAAVRHDGGRLFVIGVGGGAGHASHAASDLRKVAGFEAYAPSDNVSELTARANDDGWDRIYSGWLEGSRLGKRDAVLVFSVGGGDETRGISVPLVRAIDLARSRGAKVLGVVGRDGGYTARYADACVIIPNVQPANVTSHTESFQALVWHLLIAHPLLRAHEMKWESVR